MSEIDENNISHNKNISSHLEEIWPDATEDDKVKLNTIIEHIKQEHNMQLNHIETNKLDNKSNKQFFTNWKQLTGYICAAAIAYYTIIEPFLRFIAVVFLGYTGTFPEIDNSIIGKLLTGLIGL